jgi:hypothetical protein
MYEVDTKDLKRLTALLELTRERALPYAVRNSLNRSAFATRQVWQREIEDEFVTRNRYVTRSVRVDKAKGTKLPQLQAKVGSVAPFMGTQEKGGTFRGKGRHKPIPTSYAAGQQGASPRTKTIRGTNYLGALKVKRPMGRNRKQRNAMAIADAQRRGTKVALLETQKGKALVRVLGKPQKRTRRAIARRHRAMAKGQGKSQVRMLYDLSRGSVRVRPTPTLQSSLALMRLRMAKIHFDALAEQLARALSPMRG